jgi:hypothetical protein
MTILAWSFVRIVSGRTEFALRPDRRLTSAATSCIGFAMTDPPSRFPLPADVFIIHHGDDFTPVPENQKTYPRLFGMIFFGGFESMVVTARQWLATRKISKNHENSKANSIFISRNIDLAAKTP